MKDDWFLPEYRGWEDLFGRWTNAVMIILALIGFAFILVYCL